MKRTESAETPSPRLRYTLEIAGSVPSKKNLYRYTSRGGYIPSEIKQTLSALQFSATAQWQNRTPLTDVQIHSATFYVPTGRADLDNKWVCISDVLVKAGVLKDDSIKHVKAISLTAVIDPQERVVIDLEGVHV